MYLDLDVKKELIDLSKGVEDELKSIYKKYDDVCILNSAKVLKAFQDNRVTASDFNEVTGYGYSDQGRDKLEKIYADIFRAEDALVRTQFIQQIFSEKRSDSDKLPKGDLSYFTKFHRILY